MHQHHEAGCPRCEAVKGGVMERPRIEQFQDEDTYRMDWVRYFESMRIYCAAIESKLIESNRRLVAEEMESITLQERIDDLETKLRVAEEALTRITDGRADEWFNWQEIAEQALKGLEEE